MTIRFIYNLFYIFSFSCLTLNALADNSSNNTARANYNIRSGPGINNTRIGGVRTDQELLILSCEAKWCQVKAGNLTGYISQYGLAEPYDTSRNTSSDGANSYTVRANYNIRSGPGTNNSRIGGVLSGSPIEVKSCTSGWCQVTANGVDGYMSQRGLAQPYTEPSAPATTEEQAAQPAEAQAAEETQPADTAPANSEPAKDYYSRANYTLREGPGINTKRIGSVPWGSKVKAHSCDGDWCKVTVNGKDGYVNKKALVTEMPDNYQGTDVVQQPGGLNFGSPTCGCKKSGGCTTGSGFGRRTSIMTKAGPSSSDHLGIDIKGGSGTGIAAVEDGTVEFADWAGGAGRMVRINHGSRVETKYMHLRKILVSPGQRVKKGELIGLMGESGKATGPHLHLGIYVNNVAKNPHRYISYDPRWLSQSCSRVKSLGQQRREVRTER